MRIARLGPAALAAMLVCVYGAVAQPAAEEHTDPIAERIAALTPRERVAQLMVVTLRGSIRPGADDRAFLSEYPPGGVIIADIVNPTMAADYVEDIRKLAAESGKGIVPFIGANLMELPATLGGSRETAFAPLPSLMAIAAADDPDTTARLARIFAEHLTAMGFNMHLGPSLALAPALPDARGSLDCLGGDPAFAARSGGAIVTALRESGVLALPMGFPGGGFNRQPGAPAVLVTPHSLLDEQDLLPYRQILELGAPIMHVDNTLVPTIDPSRRPASLSPPVIKDLLRGRLGFEGVVVVGPLDELRITGDREIADAAILAFEAGADMVYWRQAGPAVARTIDKTLWAIERGMLSQETVDAALARVLRLKDELALADRPPPRASAARRLETGRKYAKEAFAIERRAVTLVQDRSGILPLTPEKSIPAGVTGVVGVRELHGALEKHIKGVGMQPIVSARHGNDIYGFEVSRIMSRVKGMRTAICILTSDVRPAGQIQLIRELQAKDVRVVVVLVGYPSALPHLAEADAILLAYADPRACSESMKAVAEALVGKGAVGFVGRDSELATRVGSLDRYSALDLIQTPPGRLPVTIEPPFVAGTAVSYDPTISIRKAEWQFGDGTRSKDLNADKAFAQPGRYPVTLSVTDITGAESSVTFHVTVE